MFLAVLMTRSSYSQTCITPLGQRKGELIRQVTSEKRSNSYEIFNDKTRK